MNRRKFSQLTLTAPAFATLGTAATRLPIKKGCLLSMVAGDMTVAEKFAMVRDAGFEGMEVGNVPDERAAEEIRRASAETGLPIHSVMNMEHWKSPLSSPDAAVARRTVDSMKLSLRQARLWGADTVLLVPAVVTPEIRYADAWKRSRRWIEELLPEAERQKVVIAVENVWNKFLLSPLEMVQYVDSFRSPWLRAYFDVGNILLYGYPQDWIVTLGKERIAKLHFKDFKFAQRRAEFVNLREGELDWKAVHAALTEIGWQGYATVELNKGGAAYLKDVAQRMEQILMGV